MKKQVNRSTEIAHTYLRLKKPLLNNKNRINHMAMDITSSEWNSLMMDKQLLAADFWAPWCPYCMRMKPVFDTVARDYENIKFVKVNVGEESELATRYGIQGIPVIKFFCDGKEVGEIVGYLPQDALKKQIENISKNTPNCLANTSLIKQS